MADPLPAADALSDAWRQTVPHGTAEELLLPLLWQLALIIVVARLFGALARRLGQPAVVGEFAAGLALGPSVFGWLLPGVFQAVFHPALAEMPHGQAGLLLDSALGTLSQLGLILLLFLIGLEFDVRHLRWHGRAAMAISVAGVIAPFGMGVGMALAIEPWLGDTPWLGFALFLGTALSITAIPILGKIMMELNISRSRLGAVAIAAAALDDVVGWVLLVAVTAVVRAQFDLGRTLLMIARIAGFLFLMAAVVGPLLRHWIRQSMEQNRGRLAQSTFAVVLAVVFTCAMAANRIGLFSVFGALFAGSVLASEEKFRAAVAERLRDFVAAFFLPLFFAYTGLRTDVGNLGSWELWLLCGLLMVAATAGKLGGCGLAARLSGYSWRESACIGALMNTRALMALVVANLGKDLGVVPDSVFCMLVIMGLLTTFMTTPVVIWSMRGTELEPCVLASDFMRAGRPGSQ